jgi:hypothetical protein
MVMRSRMGRLSFRHWWLSAWNVWTAPHNAAVVLLTALIMIQSRAWRIRNAVPAPEPRPVPLHNPPFPQPVIIES